jgi:hypothetical protein
MAARKLKVYGWLGHIDESPHQVRLIVAAHSTAEAIRIYKELGYRAPGRDYIHQTGTPLECRAAQSNPGVLLWDECDEHFLDGSRRNKSPEQFQWKKLKAKP